MRYISVFVICLILVLVSCKKEDKKTEATFTTNTSLPQDGTPSTSSLYNGIFTVSNNTITNVVFSPTYIANTSGIASAYFSDIPINYKDTSHSVRVNKVSVNGDSLQFNTSFFNYYILPSPPNFISETWAVIGNNGIASFNFTNNATLPNCAGFNTLPDSISKSTPFSFTLNVSQFTKGKVIITDEIIDNLASYTVSLTPGTNTISITPSNISGFSTLNINMAGIIILLQNQKAYFFGGKSYQFIREHEFIRRIKILP